jgi:hypothetical protein
VVSCRLSMGQGLGLCFSCRWSVVSCQWDKGWSFVSVVGGQLSVVSGTRAGALFQLSVVSCQWDKGWGFAFSFLSAFFRFHPSISVSLGRNLSAFQDLQKRFH